MIYAWLIKNQYVFTGTQLMIKQEELEVMDAEEYSYFLAYGMTEEQHQLESLIANTCADS